MTGNRSLDEFAEGDPTPEPVPPAEETDGADAESEPDARGAEPAVAPIESTYDWTPDGAPCAACGTTVEERWRAPDGLVCIECKVW